MLFKKLKVMTVNNADILDRVRQYWLLARFDRPIGILILLWPTLWALWVAGNGNPDPLVFIVFVSGVVLMRAAGCVINDYADRDFDSHVERTKQRPIAAGRVTPKEALILFAVLIMVAFSLVLLMNRLTIMLSFGGVFLAASYPFMKRYTQLPQAYLGIAFGWAVPMAFAAQTGNVPTVAWLMYLATALWAMVYDTMYAMVDKEDDLKIGVKSSAILFGDYDRHIMAGLQLEVLTLLVIIGIIESLTWPYYLGVLLAACLSIYQQKLIYHREKTNCFKAFLNSNWFGLSVFCGLALHYLLD